MSLFSENPRRILMKSCFESCQGPGDFSITRFCQDLWTSWQDLDSHRMESRAFSDDNLVWDPGRIQETSQLHVSFRNSPFPQEKRVISWRIPSESFTELERKSHGSPLGKDERTSFIPLKISSGQMSFNDWLRCLWSRTSMWWGRNSSSPQFDLMEEWVKRNGDKSLPLIFVQGENDSHHFARQMKKRISTISMADEHICSNSEESNPISLNNSISGGVYPLNNSALISKCELISLVWTQKIFQSGFVLHRIQEEERGIGKTLDYFVHLTVTLCLSTEESFFDVNFDGDLSPRCSSRETKETCVCVACWSSTWSLTNRVTSRRGWSTS